ncbi:hypothetical protein [Bacillus pacificus]|uniref:hypothetical protein n=1 Tax=Bacillus pacificus TaxID=2026187 RepID=UPI0039F85BFD|nr:hypothetical protein [Bacillus cereus group sp. BcHK124]
MKVVGNKNVVSANFWDKGDTVEFNCEGKVMTQAIIKCIKKWAKLKCRFYFD